MGEVKVHSVRCLFPGRIGSGRVGSLLAPMHSSQPTVNSGGSRPVQWVSRLRQASREPSGSVAGLRSPGSNSTGSRWQNQLTARETASA